MAANQKTEAYQVRVGDQFLTYRLMAKGSREEVWTVVSGNTKGQAILTAEYERGDGFTNIRATKERLVFTTLHRWEKEGKLLQRGEGKVLE